MKIAEGYKLRQLIDTFVVVPVGKGTAQSFNMLSLSESSAQLWRRLERGADEAELVELLCEQYDVDKDTATGDVREFLEILERKGVLNHSSD